MQNQNQNQSQWISGVSPKAQMFGWWSGIAFFFLFFLACWPMARFIPPPSPTLSGEELIAMYSDNILMIRAAMVVGLIGAMLLVPWSATLSIQVARMEGKVPFWAITCFGAGIANAVAFYLPFIFWAGGYYRMDRMPELVQLISDITWLEFVMVFPPYALQTLAIAIPGLAYKGDNVIFPRWFCFLSIWVCILIIPGGFALFFYSGPFAWNGLLAFWTPVTVFTIYFAAVLPIVRKAIRNHAANS